MITNDKANDIVDIFKTLEELKNDSNIQYINYVWDEKNNVFNINIVPKKIIEHIDVNFTIAPEGATFQ